MMRLLIGIVALLLAGAASADTMGQVHGDPAAVCEKKKPHELCFDKPKDGVARAEYLSEPFYAIILKTAEQCSLSEEERLKAQALFPKNKVFSARFFCDEDVEENIAYTNVKQDVGFLAVYAGATMADAKTLLAAVRATGMFQGANIRRMQAKLVYP